MENASCFYMWEASCFISIMFFIFFHFGMMLHCFYKCCHKGLCMAHEAVFKSGQLHEAMHLSGGKPRLTTCDIWTNATFHAALQGQIQSQALNFWQEKMEKEALSEDLSRTYCITSVCTCILYYYYCNVSATLQNYRHCAGKMFFASINAMVGCGSKSVNGKKSKGIKQTWEFPEQRHQQH